MESSGLDRYSYPVSICVPAYNCALYINETLDCLCAQSHSNIEIIIVNDGSVDDTENRIIAKNDPRIRLISVENGGAAKARNIAYKNATGKYIIFFDADDYIGADFIEAQVKRINRRDDAVVVSGWGRFYANRLNTFKADSTPGGEISFADWIKVYWHNANPMTTPGRILIPKKIIEHAGMWNEDLSLNDDLEFFTRIFIEAKKIVFNPDSKLYYRSYINGLSTQKGPRAYQSLYESVILSTKIALIKYDGDQEVRQSCLNMLKSVLYEIYPDERRLSVDIEKKINSLGRPNIKFQSSGFTKYLAIIFGWKFAKRLTRVKS
ncbi:glycosyltransferase family 2 protein [Pedobacter frigidisoli]|uniref:Glycosyltransferase family 2 protein n=1 Tax=Pedobacter frigidisoli TaxID=2530455 RepID=A0A4R0NZ61_9SPHI|nr:glycosyltransferase family A protein [Pedobacter frigidisoli]TCD07721.1 glycosyltransferase family 2 protein [Pedobacter frigidisoli]